MKVLSKISIFLIYLLISSIFAKNPSTKYNMKFNNTINNYNRIRKSNHYNRYFNNFTRPQPGFFTIIFGSLLLFLWSALIVLYFLVNRRKKAFTIMLKSQENSLSNYMNV